MLRVGESGAVAGLPRPGGMGERAQTRLLSKYPDLGDLLLKLKMEWIAAVAAVALGVRQDTNLLSLVSMLTKPHKFEADSVG